MPIKPLLKLKRLIKARPLTPTELGYKRDPKTGRLTKPGTDKFNEKISFVKEENAALVKAYKKRIKSAESLSDKKISEQKLIDRKRQIKTRLQLMELQRKQELKTAEKRRLIDLKKRQLKDWVRKLDVVLKNSKKGTVQDIKEKLFQELFAKEIDQIKKRAILSKSTIKAYDYIHSEFTNDFYSELHKTYISTNLSTMSADSIIDFLRQLAIRIKRRKDKDIYSEFKTGKF